MTSSNRFQIALLTSLAMLAFAGNSVLCRLALEGNHIDAATFTSLRLLSGALILAALTGALPTPAPHDFRRSLLSAAVLFIYAAGFSFAYLWLSAATGALLLFASVQATMIGTSLAKGEQLHWPQWLGLTLAAAGLIAMLMPGVSTPTPGGAALMILAGAAWGAYSLWGRQSQSPLQNTATNFLLATPMALAVNLLLLSQTHISLKGILLAITSGAITSGLGYALWYRLLPWLRGTTAASVQLSVPVITAVIGIPLLHEPLTLHLLLTGSAILGGIALVIRYQR